MYSFVVVGTIVDEVTVKSVANGTVGVSLHVIHVIPSELHSILKALALEGRVVWA
jgi:hypothetical protein